MAERKQPAIREVKLDVVDGIQGRVPPNSEEAEMCVLGACIIDPPSINSSLEILNADDFYYKRNALIFAAMVSMSDKAMPCDVITLREALKERGELETIGGSMYLATLANFVPTSANIESYARIVREKSIRRRLLTAATSIVAQGYEDATDVDDFLDEAEASIFKIRDFQVKVGLENISPILKTSIEHIEKLADTKGLVTGVPTGFTELDQLTAGLHPGELIIIAGRPAMGKTSFALNIAQNAAMSSQVPSAVFSLEMTKDQLAVRMLCTEAKIDSTNIKKGILPKEDWGKLLRAYDILNKTDIFIDDTAPMSVLEMKAKARRLKAERGLGLIIVDYIQLAKPSTGRRDSNREQEISEISRSLKGLAKELSVPILALSQLNRECEKRDNKRPRLSDLRESGALEQDADTIIFIYRDEVYNEDTEAKGIAEIDVAKQRNGPTKTVEVAFLKQFTRFENLARF